MATFLATVKFTAQGAKDVRNTTKRAAGVRAMAKKMGVKVAEMFWMMGPLDGALIFEAADDEAASAFMLHIATFGNVQTQTMRAFRAAEMEQILAKLPD